MFQRILAAVGAVALLAAASCCSPKAIGALAVNHDPQETQNWCWAASGEMIMAYLGKSVSQCSQANDRFGRTDCCNIDLCPSPTEPPTFDANGNCNNCACGGWPEFDKHGIEFKTTSDAALSWAAVRQQLSSEKSCRKTPFAFSWHWPGGGGHMMVAKGYVTLAGVDYVAILDPWAPCTGDERIITYAEYVAVAGDHTHWNDYYDLRVK